MKKTIFTLLICINLLTLGAQTVQEQLHDKIGITDKGIDNISQLLEKREEKACLLQVLQVYDGLRTFKYIFAL